MNDNDDDNKIKMNKQWKSTDISLPACVESPILQ